MGLFDKVLSNLPIIGDVVSGVGKIVGAFDRPDPGPNLEHQSAVQLAHARDDFNQKMSLAQQHGIHPLSVLGVPTAGFSPVLTSGTPDASYDYGSFGAGVSQIGKALVEPPPAQAAVVDPRQERLLDAQVRAAEAKAGTAEMDYILAQRAVLTQPGKPPAVRSSNDANAAEAAVARQSGIPLSYLTGRGGSVKVEQSVAPPHPVIPGHAAAFDQAWQGVMDMDGKPVSVIRNDAINADIEMGATFQALSKVMGIERALQVTAVLENQGLLGGGLAGLGLAAKGAYDYFASQAREADKRRGFGPGRGRSSWRARPGTRNE